jgi:hypothetical protein
MADMVDAAQQIEAEHIARALAAIQPEIPAGEPGDCDDCGDTSPRLVDGLCAPCREPRVPKRRVC